MNHKDVLPSHKDVLPADLIMEFPSKSTPGKTYAVKRSNRDGVVYCDCWQWKKNRECSHKKAAYEMMDKHGIVNTPDGTVDQTDRIRKAIEDAVGSLKENY